LSDPADVFGEGVPMSVIQIPEFVEARRVNRIGIKHEHDLHFNRTG
jgi:hypothetical protein